jgi:DNA-binding XRE family transcriptional regulator
MMMPEGERAVPILGPLPIVPKIGTMRKSTHTPAYQAVLKELRAARAAAGLTQRDLGERLKVPHSWVAKVESGERRIDLVEFCWFIAACDQDAVTAAARVVGQITNRRAARAR